MGSHVFRRQIFGAVAALCMATPAFAQFAPAGPTISSTVTGQTLAANTGTITAAGAISITTNGVALTMTGTSTLINNGRIQTTGTGRAIDSNSGTANLTITNTGLISAVSADGFRVATDSAVSLTNSGTIQVTAGGQAIDWASIATKSNTLTNQATGLISAVGEDAVRPGQNGVVINAGSISATPSVDLTDSSGLTGSDGIDLRTQKTVTVTNTGTISGRHGIATDGANVGPSSLTVNNNAGTIQGLSGSGLNVDANTALPSATLVTANVMNLVGATIKGGVLAAALTADGDGIDIDGILTLVNAGDVLGLGAKGGTNNAEGIAAGGGSITNSATGRIIGSTTVLDAPNGDPSRGGNGILIDDSNGGNAVGATTVTNSGLIQGKSGFAIKTIGAFADTITNNAGGTIRGAGDAVLVGAAIQTGDGADSVTNRGAIIGDNGKAIDLQAGNDSLVIAGGLATIIGSVSGGTGANTLLFDVGTGNTFSYAGSFSLFGTVEVTSGLVTFSGANTYTGTTRITAGTLMLDGLLGLNRLDPLSSLDMNGGMLELANMVGLNGQTFSSFGLSNNSVIDLDFSSLTFNDLGFIGAGKTLTIVDALNASPYAFRLAGDYSTDADFLALLSTTTIDGRASTFRFDSASGFTDVLQAPAPVPEPATVVLVGLGSVLLMAFGRRVRG